MTTTLQTVEQAIAPALEYSLNNAASLRALATELAAVVKEKRMTTNIQGKEYVHVEAWTYAGVSIGLMPVVVSCEDISRPGQLSAHPYGKGEKPEVRYRACVELLNVHTGTVVGRAFATCSNAESKKFGFDEFSIASMAQTRATGKVYRLPLGWLMQLAGYQSTPAEEMDAMLTLSDACFEALTAGDAEALTSVSKKYKQDFGQNATFRLAGTARKAQLAPTASATAPKFATEAQQAHLLKLLKSHHNAGLRDYATGRISDKQHMDECSELIESAMTNITMKIGDPLPASDYPEAASEADADTY